VSNAKAIGYTPRSTQAATAVVNVSVSTNNASVIIPRGTELSCSVGGVNYTFTVLSSTTLPSNGNGTCSGDVTIHQGSLMTTSWTYDSANVSQKFIIRNSGVDHNTLSVSVRPSELSTKTSSWTKYSSIVPVNKTTQAFFLQESSEGFPEVYFGDGIVGLQPSHNNFITAEYLITLGLSGNGCSTFSFVTSVSGFPSSSFTVNTVSSAVNGSDIESDASIKLTAPLNYAAQDRAVVVSDYKAIILSQFGFIESLAVWGGENNVPPQYGKVYISVKPSYGNVITPATKTLIGDYIKQFNVVGITPLFVDADFTYITLSVSVDFFQSQTTLSSSEIQSKVLSSINTYFASNTVSFESEFVYSALTKAIDLSDTSIKGNLTTISLMKQFSPTFNVMESPVLLFNNAIKTVLTDTWTYNGSSYYISDDGLGDLWEFKNGVKSIKRIGTVDYQTGNVVILSYLFPIAANSVISFRSTPTVNNVVSARNVLLRLEANLVINVNILP